MRSYSPTRRPYRRIVTPTHPDFLSRPNLIAIANIAIAMVESGPANGDSQQVHRAFVLLRTAALLFRRRRPPNVVLAAALNGLAYELHRSGDFGIARIHARTIAHEVSNLMDGPRSATRHAQAVKLAAWILPKKERGRWAEEMSDHIAELVGRKARARFLWGTITRMPRLAWVLRDPGRRTASHAYQALVGILESETRTIGVVALVVVGLCGWSIGDGGLDGLLSDLKPIGGAAVLLYGAAVFVRRKFDITVRKAKQTPEADDDES
jgi:hypothetical protein